MEKHKHITHEKHKHIKHKRKSKIGVWQVSTAVLAVLLLVSVFTGGGIAKPGSGTLTEEAAADKAVEFVNQNILQGQANAVLKSIKESDGLYNIKLSVNGQEIDSYLTKDGRLFFPQAINLDETPKIEQQPRQEGTPEEGTQGLKSDKPVVELFVMSHCPYGTQIEKGILPVVKELGNNIDFEVKFVNYAMHGKKELDEQLRQYCIQKDHNDKYLQYLGKFLEADNPKEALEAIGLTESDISECVETADETYKITELYEDPQKAGWKGRFPPFKVHDADNARYGVRGSPTLVINGKTVSSGRDAQSLLNTICGTFSTQPEECSTDMTSFSTPTPGFGFGTQGGSATAAGCGA